MPEAHDKRDPSNPKEWLRHARSNLAMAEGGQALAGVLWESLCFEAQQAAEKAIKAVLVMLQQSFPKTHSLVYLFDLVQGAGLPVPTAVRETETLTEYSVEARYPSLEAVTREDYEWAVTAARRVLEWAEDVITGSEPVGDTEDNGEASPQG